MAIKHRILLTGVNTTSFIDFSGTIHMHEHLKDRLLMLALTFNLVPSVGSSYICSS